MTNKHPEIREPRLINRPEWEGDYASYTAIHTWVTNHSHKPSLCEICGRIPPYDAANISGRYLRDLSDWQWLCRKCHMISDGRLERLRAIREKYRSDISDRICSICDNKTTFSVKRNAYDWYRNPLDKSKWICKSCYNKIKYKIYIEQHKEVKA